MATTSGKHLADLPHADNAVRSWSDTTAAPLTCTALGRFFDRINDALAQLSTGVLQR